MGQGAPLLLIIFSLLLPHIDRAAANLTMPSDCQIIQWPLVKIAGGRSAVEGEFPSFVAIRIYLEPGKGGFSNCGGSILTRRHVLTAAHCVSDKDGNLLDKEIYVLPTIRRSDDVKALGIRAAKVCRSNQFKRPGKSKLISDIAVIKLDKDIEFNDRVQAACLTGTLAHLNQQAWAIGLGAQLIDDGGVPRNPQTLQVLPVKVSECNKDDVHQTTICFASNTEAHVGDSCQGDSGGGIYVVSFASAPVRQVLVGVTSYGPAKCQAGVQGKSVNANIFTLKSEIKSLVDACS